MMMVMSGMHVEGLWREALVFSGSWKENRVSAGSRLMPAEARKAGLASQAIHQLIRNMYRHIL